MCIDHYQGDRVVEEEVEEEEEVTKVLNEVLEGWKEVVVVVV